MTAERPTPDAQMQEKIQAQLDEALEDSFPASDPVSIVTSQTEEDWISEAVPTAELAAKPAAKP